MVGECLSGRSRTEDSLTNGYTIIYQESSHLAVWDTESVTASIANETVVCD